MKIWNGYGSDHSASLVLIGEFKSEEDAAKVSALINQIEEAARDDEASDLISPWGRNELFSEATEQKLRNLNLWGLSSEDVADFIRNDISHDQVGATLRFRTEDTQIGGFVKLMVDKGAMVHVYSAHDYPDGRSSQEES